MNKEELYSPDDIKRYVDGTMSREEMHRLEKDALDDPFLQDALDGYMEAYASGEAEKIPAIIAGLENSPSKKGAKKYRNIVIPIWQIRIMKYAVAAMFVGGAGWYFLHDPNSINQPIIASTKQELKGVVSDSAANNVAVSTVQPPVADSGPKPIKPVVTSANNDLALTDNAKLEKLPPPGIKTAPSGQEVADNEVARPPAAPLSAGTTASKPAAIITGKVTNAENDPLDHISLNVKGSKSSTVTDDKGRFNLGIPDSNAVIVASAPGYITKERRASWFRNNALQLETANASLDEVVVSGNIARKNKIVAGPDIEIDTSEAVPEGGWKNFISYLDKNNKRKQHSHQPDLVIFTFEVDRSGKPEEFDIVQTGGDLLDDEAIRLIKDGPLWINKTRNPSPVVKLTIVF